MPGRTFHKGNQSCTSNKERIQRNVLKMYREGIETQITSCYCNPMHDILTVKYNPNIFKTHIRIAASNFEKNTILLDRFSNYHYVTLIHITPTLAAVSSITLSIWVIFHFCFYAYPINQPACLITSYLPTTMSVITGCYERRDAINLWLLAS
jgi:hypothetical protein